MIDIQAHKRQKLWLKNKSDNKNPFQIIKNQTSLSKKHNNLSKKYKLKSNPRHGSEIITTINSDLMFTQKNDNKISKSKSLTRMIITTLSSSARELQIKSETGIFLNWTFTADKMKKSVILENDTNIVILPIIQFSFSIGMTLSYVPVTSVLCSFFK